MFDTVFLREKERDFFVFKIVCSLLFLSECLFVYRCVCLLAGCSSLYFSQTFFFCCFVFVLQFRFLIKFIIKINWKITVFIHHFCLLICCVLKLRISDKTKWKIFTNKIKSKIKKFLMKFRMIYELKIIEMFVYVSEWVYVCLICV